MNFKEKIESFLLNRNSSFYIIIACVIITFFSFFAPILFTQINFVDFSRTGQIGDTIGGIMNPFISLVVAGLTFLAFNMQYQANKGLEKQLKEQQIQFKKSQIENQFYEMLKLHKENLNSLITKVQQNHKSIKLNDTNALSIIISELKGAYDLALSNFVEKDSKTCFNEAYDVLYSGYFDTDKRKHPFFSSIFNLKGFSPTFFNGYASEFSRYYRHLFQMVKFIVNQDQYLTYEEQRNFLRLLRAQLSNEEQVLLFYNWYSCFGKQWENEENRFFTDYRMIHNIHQNIIFDDIILEEIFDINGDFKKEKNREIDPLFEYQDF